MDQFQNDGYVVFLRADPAHALDPEANEQPLAECHTYQEARRIKQQSNQDCVIRFAGVSGGGD